MMKIVASIVVALAYSFNAFSYGEGVCVTFADGHGQCISDVDKNSATALALKKQASESFKSKNKSAKEVHEVHEEHSDYVKRFKESAVDMLIKSTQKYKQGSLSKDQYIEVAMQVSKAAEYANKNGEETLPAEPLKSQEKNLPDKYFKNPNLLPMGSPNIENISDAELGKMENKQVSQLREKFKELQNFQKSIGILELNLKCASDSDCLSLPVGQKMCGGPVSYLLVSQLDSNFSRINEKLKKFKELDGEFEDSVKGFYGTCDFVMPPKSSCQNNVCSANKN